MPTLLSKKRMCKMGVYIKDMEMPENCRECEFIETFLYFTQCCRLNKRISYRDAEKGRLSDCPLVEVTNPHGRLIDADELYGAIVDKGQRNERGKYRIGDFWELTGREIREVVDEQPTIIEAEVSIL